MGQTTSDLSFEGDLDAELRQRVAMVGVDLRLPSGWGFGVAAGAVLGGELSGGGVSHELGTGWTAGARATRRLVHPDGWVPFVDGELAFTFATTPVEGGPGSPEGRLTATDARLSATLGTAGLDPVVPFVRGALFGGPVFWDAGRVERTGSDRQHYQLGLGVAVLLFDRVDLFADWAPVGERRIAAGVGLRL